ncbi:MAG TPA: DMT family transporter [Candidatus Acidoferrum sp.]|nr:DMT family transporter [Candidatus Acidoferrum sp.]
MSDQSNSNPNGAAHHPGAAEWVILSLPGLIWGASYLFIADSLGAIGPGGVTLVRLVIGFLTLSLFPSARKPVLRSDWWKIVALGVFWLAFPLGMFPFAERYVSSALTGMLNGANPLFTTSVAALIAWKLPSRRVMVGIAIGMAGTIVMGLPTLSEGHSTVAGVGMILVALVFVRRVAKSGESAAAAKWIVARGAARATDGNGAGGADWVSRCAAREVGTRAATSVTRIGRAEYGNRVCDYGCFIRTIRGSKGVVRCIFDSCRGLAAWRDFPGRARRADFHSWRNYLRCRGPDYAQQASSGGTS